MTMTFEDPRLEEIRGKIEAGSPLDAADASRLYRSTDLLGIAQLAEMVRARKHGNRAWCVEDSGLAPVSAASRNERIAALLSAGEADSYEPPLRPELTGHAYLKDIAAARLLQPGVRHIRARMCPAVENVCQMALRFGADTLVGPDLAELERQARAAGREVVPVADRESQPGPVRE